MPTGIGKHIPRHIALLAAAAIPLALLAGVAILHFRIPSKAPSSPTALQHSEFSLQNSPAPPQSSALSPQSSSSSIARLTPPLRLDPFDVLAHAKTPDPALKAWLDNWQTQWSNGHDPDADQLLKLNALLEKSPLDSVDMLALAHAFHHLSDDIPTTARFYDAASLRIDAELNEPGLTIGQSMPVLMAISQHIEDYKHVLWPLIENRKSQSHAVYAEALYRIYSNFVRCVPVTNDPNLIAASHHPAIGAAECLYALDRTSEAASSLSQMPIDRLTSSEKVAYGWIYGLVLYRQKRYSEAVPQFKSAVEDPTFQYAKDATNILAASLALSGDKAGAMEMLKKYIKTYHPEAREIVPILNLINGENKTQ